MKNPTDRLLLILAICAVVGSFTYLAVTPDTSRNEGGLRDTVLRVTSTATATPVPTSVASTTTQATVVASQPPTSDLSGASVATSVPETSPAVASATTRPVDPNRCGGWLEVIERYFPADQVVTACRVMLCESHGYGEDPTTIVNKQGSSASGLFQFIDSTWRAARELVPGASQYARAMHAPGAVQIEVAAAWWRATSWSQWECA